ncbi:MAG: hypothetical protein DLD55_03220 [candidate division SR1 bacterium]|nr:MAG: hypothetical protein DLD55_03220 [candidate division SR1 bacterium]
MKRRETFNRFLEKGIYLIKISQIQILVSLLGFFLLLKNGQKKYIYPCKERKNSYTIIVNLSDAKEEHDSYSI